MRERLRCVFLVGLAALMTGCALNPSGEIKDIDPAGLPQRLVGTPAPTREGATEPVGSAAGVYFLRDEALVEIPRSLGSGTGQAAIQQLLDALTAGPGQLDRDRGLSTALPPEAVLRVTGVDGDIATVDLALDPLPPNQTAAIAQIVLTVTSLREVNALRLTLNGEPIDAPLSDGAQTNRPLTRSDYASMLASSP